MYMRKRAKNVNKCNLQYFRPFSHRHFGFFAFLPYKYNVFWHFSLFSCLFPKSFRLCFSWSVHRTQYTTLRITVFCSVHTSGTKSWPKTCRKYAKNAKNAKKTLFFLCKNAKNQKCLCEKMRKNCKLYIRKNPGRKLLGNIRKKQKNAKNCFYNVKKRKIQNVYAKKCEKL